MEISDFLQMYEQAKEINEKIKASDGEGGVLTPLNRFEQMLGTLAPYMSTEMQRQLEIVGKLNRMKNMFDKFYSMAANVQKDGGVWQNEMLNSMKIYANEATQQKIDFILAFYDLSKRFQELV